ncbi:MAG: OadG family protein [Saprospiraceae bacterium]
MESTVSNAFLLMGVGMITVFLVLTCVVLVGSLLIKIMNKYGLDTTSSTQKATGELISNKEIAVITAVVDQITLGKGKIDSIKKIKK